MAWNFSDDKPIFQQLIDFITLDIICGKYKPGDKLEPVRELAVTAGVNPNTMQRALAAIEDTGLIYTKRGDGRYIGEDTAMIQAIRENYVRQNVRQFLDSLKALGLEEQEILDFVGQGLHEQQAN